MKIELMEFFVSPLTGILLYNTLSYIGANLHFKEEFNELYNTKIKRIRI